MARAPWPAPPADATNVWLIADTHFDDAELPWAHPRALDAGRDVEALAVGAVRLDAYVHGGDLVDDATGAEDTSGMDWLATYLDAGGVPGIMVIGNHDLHSGRTRAQWEAAYGRPGNTSTLIGQSGAEMRIIGVSADAATDTNPGDPWTLSAATLSFLDGELTAAGSTPCWIVCHYALAEQTGGDPLTDKVQPHDQIASLISSHANVVGWLAGHQHYPTTDPKSVQAIAVGNRTAMPAVCGPSTALRPSLGRASSAQGVYRSLFVSYLGDRVEVRVRDHGARRWAEGEGGVMVDVINL